MGRDERGVGVDQHRCEPDADLEALAVQIRGETREPSRELRVRCPLAPEHLPSVVDDDAQLAAGRGERGQPLPRERRVREHVGLRHRVEELVPGVPTDVGPRPLGASVVEGRQGATVRGQDGLRRAGVEPERLALDDAAGRHGDALAGHPAHGADRERRARRIIARELDPGLPSRGRRGADEERRAAAADGGPEPRELLPVREPVVVEVVQGEVDVLVGRGRRDRDHPARRPGLEAVDDHAALAAHVAFADERERRHRRRRRSDEARANRRRRGIVHELHHTGPAGRAGHHVAAHGAATVEPRAVPFGPHAHRREEAERFVRAPVAEVEARFRRGPAAERSRRFVAAARARRRERERGGQGEQRGDRAGRSHAARISEASRRSSRARSKPLPPPHNVVHA